MRRTMAVLGLSLILAGCQQSGSVSPAASSIPEPPAPATTIPAPASPTTRPSTATLMNGQIAFRRFMDAARTTGEIFAISPDGTGLRQVTSSPADSLSTEPSWSADGHWIVYMVAPFGDLEREARLARIRPDGTDMTDLAGACTGACLSDGFPAFDPSGQLIAFQRGLGPQVGENNLTAIFVMDADGTDARQVTQPEARSEQPNQFHDLAPTFAPDGASIAFERLDMNTYHHAVFTVALDGSGEFQVTPWELDASQPDYSPDGEWLLVRSNETSRTEGNVWLVRPDGKDAHAVTDAVDGEAKWLSGSFSPDGAFITSAMGSILDGQLQNPDVYVMRLDGTGPMNVTDDPDFWDSSPEWGPAS